MSSDLLTSARRQLGGAPLIVVWDNASTHHAKALREFCDRNSDRLTIVKLPPYAPDLNPVEGVWAHDRRTHPAREEPPTQHPTPPRSPDGFIAETGLQLEPPVTRHPTLSTSASLLTSAVYTAWGIPGIPNARQAALSCGVRLMHRSAPRA